MHEVAFLCVPEAEKIVPVLFIGDYGEISCGSFDTKNVERLRRKKVINELLRKDMPKSGCLADSKTYQELGIP